MSSASRPMHVLIVEDDPDDAHVILRAFDSSTIDTDTHVARDGMEALDYLYQRNAYSPESAPRPDLILLDLNLPKLDGRAVLKELKYTVDFRRIPVVILTTSDDVDDVQMAYDLGVNSYIAKPDGQESFQELVLNLERYWFQLVVLPEKENTNR